MTDEHPFIYKLTVSLFLAGMLFALGYALRHTVSLVLLSFVLAYLLDPMVVYLERKRIRRIYGILALFTVLSVIFYFCLAYLVPFLTPRWYALLHDLPIYVQQLQQLIIDWGKQIGPSYAVSEWNWIFETVRSNIDAMLSGLGAGVYAAAGKVVFNLLNLLLSPVLVFFMLLYKREFIVSTVSWLPASKREFILDICRDINRSIGGFLRGQILVSILVAVLSAIVLVILGIDHPFFCAIFAGIASIIPFVGVLLATIPPLFFAYAEYQSGVLMLKVAIAFSVIYFLEGYVVKPLVFQESLDLNPLMTIIMVMVFGELMGFWGVLLAIPITASIKIISEHLREIDSVAKKQV
jgi:putative permease